jgi:DNA modification methylase
MILQANALQIPLADQSVQCVVTSPPYYALRDYGVDGQLGLEPVADCLGWATGNPCGECYICHMVQVFREVSRVLRDDGTMWINIGDSYSNAGKQGGHSYGKNSYSKDGGYQTVRNMNREQGIFKPKDMLGIPWRLAFALQADGWYLRSDIIWSKLNPMPESVTDRPTKSHEYMFLLSKNEHYFYDQEAIKEPATWSTIERLSQTNFDNQPGGDKDPKSGNRSERRTLENLKERYSKEGVWSGRNKGYDRSMAGGAVGIENRKHLPYPMRNRRTVWEIPTEATPYAHFATYPRALVEPCIKAGSRIGDIVLDPFAGSGTTGVVCQKLGRSFIGLDLSYTYLRDIAKVRLMMTALEEWESGIKIENDGYHDLPLFDILTSEGDHEP